MDGQRRRPKLQKNCLGDNSPRELYSVNDPAMFHRKGGFKIGLYDVGKAIGSGNFATVRVGIHSIAKSKVAVKVIDTSVLDEENLIKIEREIRILKTIEHSNIVKAYEVIREDKFIYIITEFCQGGELYERLIEKGRVSENQAREWLIQISSAVQYLHEKGIVHRDLKAENVLLTKEDKIKLIDFGFSNIQQPDTLLNTWCGSPPYTAPELLLLGTAYDGLKADIWSLGVLLYILVTGGFPFPSDTQESLKRSILSGTVKIPYWVSVECSDLIRKMLVLKPAKRYSIQNVTQHRWMTGGDALGIKPSSSAHSDVSMDGVTIFPVVSPVISLFMQQHGKWTEDMILDAVNNRDLENPIQATYELLCDKVGRIQGSQVETHHRGSRGSIISGRSNVEEPKTNTISAHQFAQLNLSNTDCESDDSSNSDICEDSPCTSTRKDHEKQFGVAAGLEVQGNRNELRRHTLCASEQILGQSLMQPFSPTDGTMQNAFLPSPLGMMPEGQPANFFPTMLLPPFYSTTPPLIDYTKMLPIPNLPERFRMKNGERRASAGETLLPTGFDLYSLGSPSQQLPTTSKARGNNVEEEGQSYLTNRGGKRNTVHCLGNQLGGNGPSAFNRLARSPYTKAPPAERRSSWASPTLTSQQQSHLEKLFKQTIQGNNDLQKLQTEFQTLSYEGGPSQGSNEANTNLPCPQISITDENNRQHSLAPSTINFDPVTMFEHKANELVFGQRPATVIGYSSTTSFSGNSTPDQSSRSVEDRVKSFVSSLPFASVIEELKNGLNQLKISFQESNELVYDNQEMRRLSLPTGVEIGVAVLPPEQKSHVEFAILSNDSPTSEILCEQLINRLRMIEPVTFH